MSAPRRLAADLLRLALQRRGLAAGAPPAADRRAAAAASAAAAAAAFPGAHAPSPAEAAAATRRNALTAAALLAAAGGTYAATRLHHGADAPPAARPPAEAHLVNWSGTHEVAVEALYEPESLAELEAAVAAAHAAGRKLRAVGSALSPNGLPFEPRGMVSLAQMDKVLKIDKAAMTVTVQAGARVQAVADALRPHGLTLQNYASIREQTVGGFTQVSAHGTGAAIPPADATVVAMKLVTPAEGTLRLSASKNPELLRLAAVGLGCLGVAAELTLRVVPAHRLLERTHVATRAEVRRRHVEWLRAHRHLRYMWIPGVDAVVVVRCDPLPAAADGAEAAALAAAEAEAQAASGGRVYTTAERAAPLRALLEATGVAPAEAAALTWTELRDALVAAKPLDARWIAQVNAAEAEFWRRSAGARAGWSDEVLGFECGGQQWVLEVAFPAGTLAEPSLADLDYMDAALRAVERRRVPAPAPIEQRWSAGSPSAMSPAAGPPGALFSWVGVIMYLPPDAPTRDAVTASFKRYAAVVERELMPRFGAVEHWAKLEVPEGDPEAVERLRARLAARYPLAEFAAARARLDPRNVLGNALVDVALAPEA
jgi:L-galactono-1,4-lactone dehydrogenase